MRHRKSGEKTPDDSAAENAHFLPDIIEYCGCICDFTAWSLPKANNMNVERDNKNASPVETTTPDQVEEGEINHPVDQPVTSRRFPVPNRLVTCLNACNIVIEYFSAWRACRTHCFYIYGTTGWGRR
ncbi:hypothetical protein GHT06_015532 [Daphnia sinensis]|uniref:Uncharacterized protein n=1 Tax=Daphnia sinensis TaxID=1820382 RepID=A0AAD5LAN1_9CRUS|nr:hypothetical protein GHT06_015532 [Daphnia sinensis]